MKKDLSTINYGKINQDDLFKLVAQEIGCDERTVINVVKNFFRSLRYYFLNPLDAKTGIKLYGFVKFDLSIHGLNRQIDRLEAEKELKKDKFDPTKNLRLVEHKLLLDKINKFKDGKRQASKESINERFNKRAQTI